MTLADRYSAMAQFRDPQATEMRPGFGGPPEYQKPCTASWDLGGLHVLGTCGAAPQGSCGEREIRDTRSALVAVAFSAHGVITGTRDGAHYVQQPGEMLLLDLTEPFVISWPSGHSAFVIQISRDEFGLAGDVIRCGVRDPQADPMYDLVRGHVARVCAALPTIDCGPAARVLGDVTRDLVRALVASNGAPPQKAPDAPEEPLPLRIELYIRAHLGDPALSAQQIAEAHFISVRHLYYLWSGRDRTLAEWIMSERLAAAGRELASPHSSAAISEVARRWGFADPTHFSRRFKDRYHLTPRRWRQLHMTGVPS